MPAPQLSRRAFVVGAIAAGGVTAGAGTLAWATSGAGPGCPQTATTYTTMWQLDHDWGYPLGAHGRSSCRCKACVLHARNKVFASLAAASAGHGRAHAGCLCVPVAVTVPTTVYAALFGSGSPSADRRTPAVSQVLARSSSPVVCPPAAASPSGSPTAPTTAPLASSRSNQAVLPLIAAPASSGPSTRGRSAATGSAGPSTAAAHPTTSALPNGAPVPSAASAPVGGGALAAQAVSTSRVARGGRTAEIGIGTAAGVGLLTVLLWLRRRNVAVAAAPLVPPGTTSPDVAIPPTTE